MTSQGRFKPFLETQPMQLFKLFVVTALAVFCSSLDAHAISPEGLAVYVTTDPDVAKTKPTGALGNPWAAPAAGAPVTIAPGSTVWFGFLNTQQAAKRKYFRFQMDAPAGGILGLTLANSAGFEGGDDSAPADKFEVSFYTDGQQAVREYRFSPQPEWERMSYTNPVGGTPVVVSVSAKSACANRRPDVISSALTITAASIGSATLGAMYGTPHYKAIWIFPVSNPVDPQAAQPFSAPPLSGNWQHSVVFQTPFGEPRPRGGVLWLTQGVGLQPDEDFSLSLSMLSSLADDHYEFYAFDASSQATMKLNLDWTNLEPIAYCSAKINSLGCVPAIGSQGMPSASAQAGFFVTCTRVLNNKPGVMLYSLQGQASNPFQGGLLCVQSPIRRTIASSSGGNPGPAIDCSGAYSIDMNAFAAGLLGGTPAQELRQPGRGVDCQWWSRDPQAQFGSSLSDALEYVVGN